MMARYISLAAVIIAAGISFGYAAEPLADGHWDSLTPEQKQRILQGRSFAADQERVKANYECWRCLPSREKAHLRRHWQHFTALPMERRQRLRDQYQRWKRMDPDRSLRVHRRFMKWQQLPCEERQRLYDTLKRPCNP
jgi:hypothetical protein